MRAAYWWCFFFGYMFHAGHDMFLQDIWGLEKYIEVVRLHWVDLHWVVGLGVMILAVFLCDREISKHRDFVGNLLLKVGRGSDD